MVRGECHCGAVAFEIDSDPENVFVCHCSICRHATGSNGIAVVIVPLDAFHWLSGEDHISTWKKPDSAWTTWFCRKCGTRVPGENDATNMFVPAALISADHAPMKVAHRIWVDSAAGWDRIPDDGRRHPRGYQA